MLKMFKAMWSTFKFLIGLMLTFLTHCRYLICRRRRNSDVAPAANFSAFESTSIDLQEEESWSSWDVTNLGRPSSFDRNLRTMNKTQDHINAYRQQQQQQQQQEPGPTTQVDYFQDLTPEVKKAPKILVRKKDDTSSYKISSRLAVTSEVPNLSTELDTWDEAGNAWGFEAQEDLSCQAEAAIKENRRLERQERQLEHQRRKLEREIKSTRKDSHSLGIKIS